MRILLMHKDMPTFRHLYMILTCFLALCVVIQSCQNLLTEPIPEGETFDGPFPGLSFALNASFARGDEGFDRVFTVSEGLGPTFNQPSCATCHPGDGRGTPETVLIRFSAGKDLIPELGGDQLQDKSIPGVPFEILPPQVDISPRMAPPVIGMGLIEGIPESVILNLADPDDLDGDGISGRVNIVRSDAAGKILVLGRFGRKANKASLLDQVVSAYHQDMGITSDFMPTENPNPQAGGFPVGDTVPDPEIPMSDIEDVVMYLRLLAPPNPGEKTPKVLRGEALFEEIGCTGCHIPSLKTGKNTIPQLSEVKVNLYSDLLLHDMGAELADNRPDWEADGREWRTSPLWGLRLAGDPLGGKVHYLHDGRTSDIAKAIQFHGGEAERARNRFLDLSEDDRNALIAFLLSL